MSLQERIGGCKRVVGGQEGGIAWLGEGWGTKSSLIRVRVVVSLGQTAKFSQP